jgi:hypothetical protein
MMLEVFSEVRGVGGKLKCIIQKLFLPLSLMPTTSTSVVETDVNRRVARSMLGPVDDKGFLGVGIPQEDYLLAAVIELPAADLGCVEICNAPETMHAGGIGFMFLQDFEGCGVAESRGELSVLHVYDVARGIGP